MGGSSWRVMFVCELLHLTLPTLPLRLSVCLSACLPVCLSVCLWKRHCNESKQQDVETDLINNLDSGCSCTHLRLLFFLFFQPVRRSKHGTHFPRFAVSPSKKRKTYGCLLIDVFSSWKPSQPSARLSRSSCFTARLSIHKRSSRPPAMNLYAKRILVEYRKAVYCWKTLSSHMSILGQSTSTKPVRSHDMLH